jgi:hypothetical protein
MVGHLSLRCFREDLVAGRTWKQEHALVCLEKHSKICICICTTGLYFLFANFKILEADGAHSKIIRDT